MKKSIAQKKALEASIIRSQMQKEGKDWKPAGKAKKVHPLAALLACIPFAGIWYAAKYVFAGYQFTALVCLCIIGVILFYGFMPVIGRVAPRFARVCTIVFTVALVCGLIVCGTTEYFIIRASSGTENPQSEYLVVLGAKVREDGPSVSLMDRIQAAAQFLQEHPNVTAIVSGGKGEDEHITEAQCMRDELVKLGIAENRIWMEDRASSTDENLRFSLDLIEEKTGQRPQRLAFLSSEYHLLRTSLMAKKLGIEYEGVPAKTSNIFQLINHAMREVAGVWHFFIFGR